MLPTRSEPQPLNPMRPAPSSRNSDSKRIGPRRCLVVRRRRRRESGVNARNAMLSGKFPFGVRGPCSDAVIVGGTTTGVLPVLMTTEKLTGPYVAGTRMTVPAILVC